MPESPEPRSASVWPKSVSNPTWHDHVYSKLHSPKDGEEHHQAVDLLCDRVAVLEAALKAVTMWSANGEQLCFRTSNNVPMGMSRKQERLVRKALTPDAC